MKDLLIYTVVSGRYKNYVPLWKHFIKEAYPECDTYVLEIPDEVCSKRQKYYPACMRYIIDPPCDLLGAHEYFYITDIDVMILRENPSLFDFHTSRIKDTFSNISRNASEVNECGRLTGLHFVHKDWFKATQEYRWIYYKELGNCVTGNKLWDDEVILFKIAKMSGLRIPEVEDPFRFHHGIHLGNQRNISGYSEDKKRKYMIEHISPTWAARWREVSKTKGYILEKESLMTKDKQIYNEIITVEKYVDYVRKCMV